MLWLLAACADDASAPCARALARDIAEMAQDTAYTMIGETGSGTTTWQCPSAGSAQLAGSWAGQPAQTQPTVGATQTAFAGAFTFSGCRIIGSDTIGASQFPSGTDITLDGTLEGSYQQMPTPSALNESETGHAEDLKITGSDIACVAVHPDLTAPCVVDFDFDRLGDGGHGSGSVCGAAFADPTTPTP